MQAFSACTMGTHPEALPMPTSPATIPDLLAAGADDAPALRGAHGVGSFAELRATVARLAGQLRGAGVGPGDRVALTLPNGPVMAAVLLAAASAAVAAPLNPRSRAEEVRRAFAELGVRAVAAAPDGGEVPDAPGVRRLAVAGEGLDVTLTDGGAPIAPAPVAPPAPDATALVLQTSGTTARPKTVPLTHANLAVSAASVARSLALAPDDCGLVAMPLFHIHGIVAGLLAPLAAGGAVACPGDFSAFRFFDWLDEYRPTWYTAVPTMHQLILARAHRHAGAIARARLRFVRSSSAPLPPVVLERVEAAFRAPMIEAYGMTEASHQMAAQPLPPGARKPGSVGRPAGVELAVLAPDGAALPPGGRGEIAVRGPGVTAGYEANPEANAAAFTADGWFRTGDEGYLDGDGYLFLTGRLKEIINRGGEKIAPREVEEAILRHPAVRQAVCFALPHATLGEEVATAVVRAEGADGADALDEAAVRGLCAERLAPFKVPRAVVFVDEIPVGPTGKLQRIGLAERLGLAPQ